METYSLVIQKTEFSRDSLSLFHQFLCLTFVHFYVVIARFLSLTFPYGDTQQLNVK